MEIYPNPSANSFNIKLQTLDEAKVTMSIYNNLCQPAGDLTKDLKLSKGEYNFKLNPTGLSEGMYFVNVAIHYLNGKKESHSVKIIYRK